MAPDVSESQRLLAAAIDGGADEVGALLEGHRPRLVLWAATRIGPDLRVRYDAEDVAQEVLLSALKGFRSFRGASEREFLGWMYAIAENRFTDLLAAEGAAKRTPPDPLAGPRTSLSQTSPSQAAARAEAVASLRDAIEALADDHRTAIRLVKLEGRDVADVARAMGRSENAVRILYCRAIRELRTRLDGRETPGGGSRLEGRGR